MTNGNSKTIADLSVKELRTLKSVMSNDVEIGEVFKLYLQYSSHDYPNDTSLRNTIAENCKEKKYSVNNLYWYLNQIRAMTGIKEPTTMKNAKVAARYIRSFIKRNSTNLNSTILRHLNFKVKFYSTGNFTLDNGYTSPTSKLDSNPISTSSNLIVAKIEWMEHYRGEPFPDPTHGYTKSFRRGAEQNNFKENSNGIVKGYAPHKRRISLERMNKLAAKESKLSPVLIVWVAKRPKPESGVVVVGWYRNGIVYREFDNKNLYQFEADVKDVTLLSLRNRTLEVPIGNGCMGSQAAIWYADKNNEDTAIFRRGLEKLVHDVAGAKRVDNKKGLKSRVIQDTEERIRVEQQAIATTTSYFESKGYLVRSVESENVGYDLLIEKAARSRSPSLVVEVKGRTIYDSSSVAVDVSLTPNEFAFFKRRLEYYRLAIVCISGNCEPVLHLCRYSSKAKKWILEGKRSAKVNIAPVTAGRVTVLS